MPRLDVTRVLRSREFREAPGALVCTRNTQTVGSDGLAVNASVDIPFFGVVTSDKGDILTRLAEGSYIQGSITIHSQFPLLDGTFGKDADIVSWNGHRYTVSSVNNYSSWGRGFTAATCEPISLAGLP